MEIVASWPSQGPLAGVPAWAARAEQLGFDVLHIPETVHDPFVASALALTATSRVRVRTSMALAFPRSPMLTAVSAWDLARLSDGRFQLGLASQVRGNIVDRYAAPWSEPVARLGDYVAAVRAVFASFRTGAPLHHEGPHYRLTRLQPYFNPGPLADDAHEPTIWTGGVNPRMCRLGGRIADGFVCHPTSSHPEVLREHVLPALREGRRESSWVTSQPLLVAGPQPVTTRTEGELDRAVHERRRELAFLYSTPAYRLQLETFGLGDIGDELGRLVQAKQWADLERVLTDEVITRMVPVATVADLPGVLHTWYAGLVDGIVLALPEQGALDDEETQALVAACRAIPVTSARP